MKKLVVILGPTASGKTDLAIELAKEFDGEIVGADSRQIYKEMIIGTASPCQCQMSNVKCLRRRTFGSSRGRQNRNSIVKFLTKPIIVDGISHHLFCFVQPNEEFNVAIYKKLALEIIKDIQNRGNMPFLVGGTGLYIKAVVDNLKFPEIGPQKKLREKLEKKSTGELFEIYKRLDPEGAKFIEKRNKRRLIRAIEVCKATGKSFWKQRSKEKPLFDVLQIGIKKIEKEGLKDRIEKRTDKMFKLGLEQEVKKLLKKYGLIPPLQSIGYQEWTEYLKGKIARDEVREKIILHTLQFAKRQMTWFKKSKRIHWVKSKKEAQLLIKEFLS